MKTDVTACSLSGQSARIVILEEDGPLAMAIATSVWAATGMKPCTAATVSEAMAQLEAHPGTVFAVALNIDTPDINRVLETLTEHQIPAIAYGEEFTDEDRKTLASWSISQLVVGPRLDLPQRVGEAFATLNRNQNVTVLVVDDSRSMRAALVRFLAIRRYNIREATNGIEALEVLRKHPGVRLVITDNEMPEMDGYTLVKEIRRTYSKDDLAVIGISAKTASHLSVMFINVGANDFLHKPFVKEELYCRVDHNLEMLHRIETIRDLSNKDHLTRLYNRRYFFDHSEEFIDDARSRGRQPVVAMLDIDYFKAINDTHGHDGGDEVLRTVAALIGNHFEKEAIVCRFGGEEFCVLTALEPGTDCFARFDMLRRTIEALTIEVGEERVSTTVSIGVCTRSEPLPEMLKEADRQLYEAKRNGRNRVCMR